jgi:hypothetical protein
MSEYHRPFGLPGGHARILEAPRGMPHPAERDQAADENDEPDDSARRPIPRGS